MTDIPLFSPFSLRGVTAKNRIMLAPMCQYQAEDGVPSGWHRAHHGRYATSGVGSAVVEATGVNPAGRISPGCPGLYNDAQVEGWRRITALYHAEEIPVFVQLNHAGAKASTMRPWDGGGPLEPGSSEPPWQTYAPSAIPAREGWHTPKALTVEEIAGIIDDFAAAARRALDAGFDGVEIHGAHGYLLHEFMSPFSNKRDDDYGGPVENRMRLPVEVARAIRAVLPDDMPLLYRASCVDGEGGSLTLDDTVALCHALKAEGVDLIDASGGGIPAGMRIAQQKPEPGFQVPYSERIKAETGLATASVGMITEPEMANDIVAEGKADLVALARGMLRDPAWPYHAAQALGHPEPASVLPKLYAFYLKLAS
ncbi:NADH:flavin oxidoreductase/NADH oxidase [Histidinibacterium aquaticum]|uniref:NADH:flavin oxidoreductase/NADH oxidase n=1 Tax=Histidinibacterium aquaticum TaxID=2613962 RepID=A0A5J5GKS8_9RHOB|nr:NADH:flavin oxidoreductase/NADH oxidase [Histidinibacterium aquaticum]KAA9008815.1 NADH:flavin oxidoreductase/NADH oxidase [Histidinibacterium aquaticum]